MSIGERMRGAASIILGKGKFVPATREQLKYSRKVAFMRRVAAEALYAGQDTADGFVRPERAANDFRDEFPSSEDYEI